MSSTLPAGGVPPDRSHILTEQRNPRSANLHRLSALECVELMNREDQSVIDAIAKASRSIASLIERAEAGFGRGGRLIYLGAGTSGRLGVLDASEAPPTFQIEPGRIIGLIAGGDSALRRSSEIKEDDPRGCWTELEALRLDDRDTVIGIAAGGTTPYVLGAFEFCKTQRAPNAAPLTAMLCCSPIAHPPHADHLIVLETGPEVLTGSTRLKAGSATKMALNIISTTIMVRSGRVYQNLMVDLRATNDKLRDRAARIVSTLTDLSRADALRLLDSAGGRVKTAVVMHVRRLDRQAAEGLLSRSHDRLDRALDPVA